MILEESEIKERMESPANLHNRLKAELDSLTHRRSPALIPSLPPKSGDIIDDLENKLKYGSLKSKAAAIMSTALDELQSRVVEARPEKLATIAEQMNKIVTAQTETKDKDNLPQIILYAPNFVSESHFETIHVRE